MQLFARTLRKGNAKNDTRLSNQRENIVLVLDNVYDTFNVGGMYRVADAAGVSKIYHCGETPVPPDPKIARSSVGLYQYISYEQEKDCLALVKRLRGEGYQIVALEQTAKSIDYVSASYKAPVALVVGNESFGVSNDIIDVSDTAIELPMYGVNKSLNVVVATGIALYEIRRKLNAR